MITVAQYATALKALPMAVLCRDHTHLSTVVYHDRLFLAHPEVGMMEWLGNRWATVELTPVPKA